jgi:hypothetical protein
VYVATLEDRPKLAHPAMTVDEVPDDTLEEWLAVLRIGNDVTTSAAAISDEWARTSHGVAGARDDLAYVDGTAAGCGSDPGVCNSAAEQARPSSRRETGADVRSATCPTPIRGTLACRSGS